MSIKITFKGMEGIKANLKRLPLSIKDNMQGLLRDVTSKMTREAKKEAPVDTGKLRQQIWPSYMRNRSVIESRSKYSLPVHEGTRSHIIRPRNKKFLAFKKGGKWIFAKKVRIPARRGNPYMKRAVDKTQPFFQARLKQALNDILKKSSQ